MRFQVSYYVKFTSHLGKKKRETRDNNIFLANTNNITHADAMAVFGLALMVESE